MPFFTPSLPLSRLIKDYLPALLPEIAAGIG